MDIVDTILKSDIIQKATTAIKDFLMGFAQNENIYLLFWVAISIGISIWISGKAISKVGHIILYASLILLGLKYIGIV